MGARPFAVSVSLNDLSICSGVLALLTAAVRPARDSTVAFCGIFVKSERTSAPFTVLLTGEVYERRLARSAVTLRAEPSMSNEWARRAVLMPLDALRWYSIV